MEGISLADFGLGTLVGALIAVGVAIFLYQRTGLWIPLMAAQVRLVPGDESLIGTPRSGRDIRGVIWSAPNRSARMLGAFPQVRLDLGIFW
jgi:hypothetical protein